MEFNKFYPYWTSLDPVKNRYGLIIRGLMLEAKHPRPQAHVSLCLSICLSVSLSLSLSFSHPSLVFFLFVSLSLYIYSWLTVHNIRVSIHPYNPCICIRTNMCPQESAKNFYPVYLSLSLYLYTHVIKNVNITFDVVFFVSRRFRGIIFFWFLSLSLSLWRISPSSSLFVSHSMLITFAIIFAP